MAQNRKCSYKGVDMLLMSKTIAGNFKSNTSELPGVIKDWTKDCATNLVSCIDQTIENNLARRHEKRPLKLVWLG